MTTSGKSIKKDLACFKAKDMEKGRGGKTVNRMVQRSTPQLQESCIACIEVEEKVGNCYRNCVNCQFCPEERRPATKQKVHFSSENISEHYV